MLKQTIDIGNRTQLTRWQEWLIPTVFCAVFLGQLLLSVGHLSQTVDEPVHLYAAYRYVRCGDLSISPEHPPLAKVIAVIPLLFMHFGVDCTPTKVNELGQLNTALRWLDSGDWRRGLARARIAISIFALALYVLVWLTARRMFGLQTAIMAVVLLAFEPNVLAYGALVLTDIPVTATLLFAVFAFYLWMVEAKTWIFVLVCLATGLTLLTKASGVVVIPILYILAIGSAIVQHPEMSSIFRSMVRDVLAVTLILCGGFGIVWAGYGMRYAADPGGAKVEEAPLEAAWTTRWHFVMRHYHVLPEAYLDGFAGARGISNNSGAAFLAGRFFPRSPWFATPFYLSIRSTAAMLVLLLLGSLGAIAAFRRRPLEWLFILLPAVIYLGICLRSSLVGGIRYVLPALPFLLIAAAAGCIEVSKHSRLIEVVVFCLIALHAFSSLHAYPDYLSYANEFWGGPANAYRYIPWTDIGQSYAEAKQYLEQHPSEKCWYFTPFQWGPDLYGVSCNSFGLYLENQISPRVDGTIIVSSDLLSYLRPPGIELAAPFTNAVPKSKIGGSSLLVYEGDFDTRFAASLSESQMMHRDLSAGRAAAAVDHGRRSVELAPDSVVPHYDFCTVLAEIGQTDEALQQCTTAQSLVNDEPLRTNPVYNEIRVAIENELKRIRTQPPAITKSDQPLSR